jgi:small subunit ribosomal protein S9
MATKKSEKVSKASKEEVKESVFAGEYFYATGKRKTSVAQVRLYPAGKKEAKTLVNGKDSDAYFGIYRLQTAVKAPLVSSGQEGKFNVSAKVTGGGISAQADAVQLGIARCLIKFDATLQKALKDLGFLTRDSRIVERKKPGHKKARKSPQWAKR